MLSSTQEAKGPAQKEPTPLTMSSGYVLYKCDAFDFDDLQGSRELDLKCPKISLGLTKRNAKKSITSIVGLSKKDENITKICKALKKKLSCRGSIAESPEFGLIIELSGDQRVAVIEFLVAQNICSAEDIVI